ncbi:uncharacterized protein A1O5_10002 [Cladophialophora psammophila CBS 110553]|uniref:SnoaL-like domain-containing protein n=1 Tax=Cladophialophora psammophila CBS 110553 TaxID=1182543 RepID=W9WFC0_9EURO|nr:uncharacterized protein A1O5_10002 [Cladophialophora psammophila CBS 110553]EXJ66807.1 hypothetical protein A1O5_10002 [Cladophialophora psammophila CBS 110553]
MATTNGTISWPDSVVPERTRKFLQKFFKLLDADSEEFAEAYGGLFAEDAVYIMSQIPAIKGRKAIAEQRAWGWRTWPGLRHEIRQIYLGDREGLDIISLGKFTIVPADGKLREGGSAAHFKLVDKDGQLLIHHLEIFST